MNIFKISLVVVITISSILTSCVKDLDFGQVSNIVLTPVFEVSFIYASKKASNFDNTNPNSSIIIPELIESDTTSFPLLNNQSITKSIEKIEITYEVNNTFEKDFIIEFKYLGATNELINSAIVVPVQAGNGIFEDPVQTIHVDVLEKTEITNLKLAKKIVSTIKATNVPSNIQGELNLRSKGSYFIKMEL